MTDSTDHTVGMSTASAIAKVIDWHGAIDTGLDYGKCPGQGEYRDEVLPAFERFRDRHGLPPSKWKDSLFAFSDKFDPASKIVREIEDEFGVLEETQPPNAPDGYEDFTLDLFFDDLLPAA